MKNKFQYLSLTIFSLLAFFITLNIDNILVKAKTTDINTIEDYTTLSVGDEITSDKTNGIQYFIYLDKDNNLLLIDALNTSSINNLKIGKTCTELKNTNPNIKCQNIYENTSRKLNSINYWYTEYISGNIYTEKEKDYGYYGKYNIAYTYIDGTPYYNYIQNNKVDEETLLAVLLFEDYKNFISQKKYQIDIPNLNTNEEIYNFFFENTKLYNKEIYLDEFYAMYDSKIINDTKEKLKKSISLTTKEKFNEIITKNNKIIEHAFNYSENSNTDLYNYLQNYTKENFINYEDSTSSLIILKEYTAPDIKFECDNTTISKGESIVCTLKYDSETTLSSIKATMSSKYLELTSAEPLNGWTGEIDEYGNYELIHPIGVEETGEALTVTLTATEDIDVKSALTLTDVSYKDATGINQTENINSNVSIVRNPETSNLTILLIAIISLTAGVICISLINKMIYLNN